MHNVRGLRLLNNALGVYKREWTGVEFRRLSVDAGSDTRHPKIRSFHKYTSALESTAVTARSKNGSSELGGGVRASQWLYQCSHTDACYDEQQPSVNEVLCDTDAMEEAKHTLILAIWLAFFSKAQELIASAGFMDVIAPSSSCRYRVAVGW